MDDDRYARHLALPDFTMQAQQKLRGAHIFMLGAGGLGAAALPYIAGAGIGTITICDDDDINITNLHRQTIFKTSETGQSKAVIAAQYVQSLNPDTRVNVVTERLTQNMPNDNFTLILDGSDNFETKSLLNTLSIKTNTPLISASVNQYAGQCGIFAGFAANKPCYHCLFPALPHDARNCNEAGVLGSAAGLTGLYQAHLTLMLLAEIEDTQPGMFLSLDYKTHRMNNFNVPKNPACPHCVHDGKNWDTKKEPHPVIDMLSLEELKTRDHIIVDVRTDAELAADPIAGALHIEVSEIPARHEELPKNKLLAFVCAGNVRSVKAAQYLAALGYENVVVLDKFSF